MRSFTWTTVVVILFSVTFFSERRPSAQSSRPELPDGTLRIAARSANDVSGWNGVIGQMLQRQELRTADVHDDPVARGRRHETLLQYHRGIPLHGAGVTRQFAGPETVSIFGTLHANVDIDVVPAFSSGDVARMLRQLSGREVAFNSGPALVVWPTPTGHYVLAYRATMANAMTYFVDANTGEVIQANRAYRDAVGSGTGVLGDVKKISTTAASGVFRTQDVLRPAGINTLDTRSSETVLDRLLDTASVLDGDFATDSDNTWTDGRIVDAHVHTGWTHDYFFKRHQWNGLDGLGGALFAIVHRNLKNNAFFYYAPLGPNRRGAIVYGETTAGVPITSLDIAAHEVMHGVTNFALTRRTGQGLQDNLVLEGFGPTSFVRRGSTFSCNTTVLTFTNGAQRPFLCNAGRFVLSSNHGGAINEAFSDVFGTGVEFFYQPPGTGSLRADYLVGEDVASFGPLRSLNNPASRSITADTGTVSYPDNRTTQLRFALVLLAGTQANPVLVDWTPLAFVNNTTVQFFDAGGDDFGGVHWNSTILSHAFYLAIEGGRNATSGVTVTGVGPQNRELIERAFFRAMTQLMPASPTMLGAAQAVHQSAIDLYGANSPATQAILQALVAVGLLT